MARMFPRELPPRVESAAESHCLQALRENLDGAYTVLYDVAWVGRGDSAGTDGQCDFLVPHPRQGALVIEVRGGNVSCDVERQKWVSDGTDRRYPIDDPYRQATRSKHGLLDFMRDSGNIAAANALWGHAVWFPDNRVLALLDPKMHPDITFDYSALDAPGPAIEAAFAYWRKGSGRPGSLSTPSGGLWRAWGASLLSPCLWQSQCKRRSASRHPSRNESP